MQIKWNGNPTPNHGWEWTTDKFENGWSAIVADESQTFNPPKPVSYKIGALSRTRLLQSESVFPDFHSAKSEAILFAMSRQIERGVF